MQGRVGRRRVARTQAMVLAVGAGILCLGVFAGSLMDGPSHAPAGSPAGSVQSLGPVTGDPTAAPPADRDARRKVRDSIVNGRLLFVGASYSIGVGATRRSEAFPNLVAARLDDPFSVDAVPGTGFQNEGVRHQGSFIQRIGRDSPLLTPRLIVIQGGRDDIGYPVSREYAAVVATIRLAERRFPEAQIVLLGPIPAMLPVTADDLAIRNAIARGAASEGAGFIDPIAEKWITVRNQRRFQGFVPGHPNDAGYAYITNRLLQELPAALRHAREPRLPDRPTIEPSP